MAHAASLLDTQDLNGLSTDQQTVLGRQWQTTQHNPDQETALAAPVLCKEYGTSNQI